MSDRRVAASITTLLKAADAVGAKLDTALRGELEKKLELAEQVTNLDMRGKTAGEAIVSAISAGRDPFTDKEVLKSVIRATIGDSNIYGGFASIVYDQLETLIIDNVDALALAFKPRFDAAGAVFADAQKSLTSAGITNLDDPNIPLGSLSVAQANVQAREALETMRQITSALHGLYVTTGAGYNHTPIGPVAQIADVGEASAETVRIQKGLRPTIPMWEIVSLGYTISLATPAQAQERVDRAYNRQEEEERSIDRDVLFAQRRTIAGYTGS